MKRRIVIAVMLALVGFGVQAQDEAGPDTWRLKTPTAAEYLAAVPSLVELGNQEAASSTYSSYYSPMFFTLTTEIYARYPELWRADPEVIYEAYKSFRTGHDFWYDRDRWTQAVILGWIQQQHVDLSRTRYLRILDYQVSVKGRDFNADGHDEWWLHIDSPDFTQDVVVAGEKGAYHIIESPLPWFGCCLMYYDTGSGFMKEQLFGDINADGLPEWVMAVGGFGANQTNGGLLYVLQWHDGKLIDITPPPDDPNRMFYLSPAGAGYPPLFPYGVHVEYTDQNRDGNHDGIEEWLVWLTEPIPALFFYAEPSDNLYQVTYTQLPFYLGNGLAYGMMKDQQNPYFDPNIVFTTRQIPDDNRRALVSVLPREYDDYSYWCPFPDTNHRSNVQYSFAMWVLKNGQLEFNGEIPFCKMVNLESVFGDAGDKLPLEVNAWKYVSAQYGTGTPATYTWDANQGKYAITSVEPLPEEIPVYTTSFDAALGDVQKAMANEKDYQKAIQILDQGLNNADLLDVQLKSLHYLRALALEALGRDDEALAAYVRIYEAAPESAWGMLARLHLEPLP